MVLSYTQETGDTSLIARFVRRLGLPVLPASLDENTHSPFISLVSWTNGPSILSRTLWFPTSSSAPTYSRAPLPSRPISPSKELLESRPCRRSGACFSCRRRLQLIRYVPWHYICLLIDAYVHLCLISTEDRAFVCSAVARARNGVRWQASNSIGKDKFDRCLLLRGAQFKYSSPWRRSNSTEIRLAGVLRTTSTPTNC